ncbi:MAG: cysteine desulfurase family protein [Armatimonadota bacterium]|nr:cysteine desulfurase [bacterium]MDW8320952.1 cysteine desulfurase family protein [Armatimonadota bacterium]
MQHIYLDHAATTPIAPEVREAVAQAMEDCWGNPSSLHLFGRKARDLLDEARVTVAHALGCLDAEVFFTSSGTESDNMAILGAARVAPPCKRHIVTTAIEHHAVLHACQRLQQEGWEVTYLPADRYGMVDPDDVRRAIRDETWLVSVMHANNEVGTIQPVREIAAVCRERGVWLHCDAVQTFGLMDVSVDELGVDMLSVSAHKLYGPKGVGALYLRGGVKIAPLLVGGAQEREMRAGTENVPAIAGFAKAVELSHSRYASAGQQIWQLRERLRTRLQERISVLQVNGHTRYCHPGILSVTFEGVSAESLLIALDRRGIAASAGAACSAGSIEPSHVLLALGMSEAQAMSTVRLSLGRGNTPEEIDLAAEVIAEEVHRLRSKTPAPTGV